MSPEELDLAEQLRLNLLGVDLSPIYDFAEGQKAELERRGWSPTAAEQAALIVLCSTIQKAIAG